MRLRNMALTICLYNGGVAGEYLAITHFLVPFKLPFIRAIFFAAPYGALPPRDSHRGNSFPSRPRTGDLKCALAGETFFSRSTFVITDDKEKRNDKSSSSGAPLVHFQKKLLVLVAGRRWW